MALIYFSGLDANGLSQLWVTDGTLGNTVEIAPAGASPDGLNPREIAAVGTLVFFQGNDLAGNPVLWVSDGSSIGTKPVAIPGENTDAGGLRPTNITRFGTGALFAGTDAGGNRQLWFTDGTGAGTINLTAPLAIPGGPDPVLITAAGVKAVFNGISSTGQSQLFVTDGSVAGTAALAIPDASAQGLNPTDIRPFGSGALFFGTDQTGQSGLWVTNGSAAGTQELAAGIGTGPTSTGLTILGNLALFNGGDNQLAVTDGTVSGTKVLTVPGASASGLMPTGITVIGDRAVFAGLRADGSAGLWITDGNAANTVELLPDGASPFGLMPEFITRFGTRALFSGVDSLGLKQLWVTDGTAQGTVLLAAADQNALSGLQPRNITVVGTLAVFEGLQANGDDQLFVTDGTPAGTVSLSPAGSAAIGLVPGNFAAGPVTALLVISITADAASKPEGNAGATPFTFTLTRAGDVSGAGSVAYTVSGGVDASDFVPGTALSGTVSFAAAETSKVITLNVAGDTTVESDESVVVTLSSAMGGTLGQSAASSTVVNDDTSLSISADAASKPEGNAGATPFTFTLTRAGALGGVTTVGYAVSGGTADAADFAGGVLPSGSVTFNANETSKQITINVAGDTVVEPSETFTVALSSPVGATVGTATAAATILNDDTTLSITADAASKPEGNAGATPFTFTLTRAGDASGAASVAYTVSGGVDGSDFVPGTALSGTVSFAAAETSKVITLNVAGDTTVESDESVVVTLSSAMGGTLGQSAASSTVVNDDTSLSISADAASKPEGNAGATPFTFTLTRAGDASGAASVAYTVSGGVDASDFVPGTALSGTVSFAAAETSKVITLNVAGDTTVESDESVVVTLSSAMGGTLGQSAASSTVVNDDTSLSISADAASKPEGNAGATPFTFTLTRAGALGGVTTVGYAVSGGTADAADFAGGVLPSGSVTFNANETSKQITINVAGDTVVEPNETFTVALSSPVGATVGTATAAATILNDDTTLSGAVVLIPVALVTTITNPAGKTVTVASFTSPSAATLDVLAKSTGGTVKLSGNTVVYTPASGTKYDSFTYDVRNQSGSVSPIATAIYGDDSARTVKGANAGYTSVILGNGNDKVTLAGMWNAVLLGNGNVSVSGSTGNTTITAGTGCSLISLGGSNNKVTTGAGSDRVTFTDIGGSNNVVNLGAGCDVVAAWLGDGNTIAGGDGDDALVLSGGSNNRVDLGAGCDGLLGSFCNGDTILGGAGNDSLAILAGSNNLIDLGSDCDALTGAIGNSNRILGGAGRDTIFISAGNLNLIDLGDDDNSFNGKLGNNNTVAAGDGSDSVTVSTMGTGNTITLGRGTQSVTAKCSAANAFKFGDGTVSLTLTGGKQNTVQLGAGSATVNGGTGDTISLVGNGGKLALYGSSETVFLGPGKDLINANVSGVGLTAKVATALIGSIALGADVITNIGAFAGSFVNLVCAPTQTYTASLGRAGDTLVTFSPGSSVDMIGFAAVAVNGTVLHVR